MNSLIQLLIQCLIIIFSTSVMAEDTQWLNESEWIDLYEYAVNKDEDEVVEVLLSYGADKQFAAAFYALSLMMTPTEERKGNLYGMTSFLRKAARRNHPEAQHRLSISYAHGLGVVKDIKSYQYWAKKAAHNGSREAQYGLGEFYFKEDSSTPSGNAKSIHWYNKAANLGHVRAMTTLGVIHIDEDFGIFHPEIALKWLWPASIKGAADAQYWLGIAFAEGIGQERSLFKAIQWWEKSADQGHKEALVLIKILEKPKPHIERSVSTIGESI